MAGLVGYASSDDEDDTLQHPPSPKISPRQDAQTIEDATANPTKAPSPTTVQTPPQQQQSSPSQDQPSQTQSQTSIGPIPLGPSLPVPLEVSSPSPEAPPSSPYTSTRTLIHDLTLPTIPNLDIPPSPPGSPPRSTTSKLQQFLTLKRQGTHFNSKLEQSASLRNPSLTDKLLSFADLAGPAQYETTLPLELYDPSGFPEWSYRGELRKARDGIVKQREDKAGSRTSIDFVSASVDSPGVSTVGASSREKRKGGWK